MQGWQLTVHGLFVPRARHTATLLHNGRVFIHGGLTRGPGTGGVTGSSELYDPEINDTVGSTSFSNPQYRHTATLLADGTVLVVGGTAAGTLVPSSQLYNPSMDTWSGTGQLHVNRFVHAATPLADGKVLVVGGLGSENYELLSSTEIYDPVTQAWAFVAELHEARMYHTATLLLDGRVLVVGGYGNGGTLDSSELYDPATGTWTLGKTLFYARSDHTATRLQDGRVLIAGGFNTDTQDSVQSCVLFYPDSGDFVDQGNLNTPRRNHTATLLYTGHVMVVGGSHGGEDHAQVLASTEFYDPSTGGWTLGPEMNRRRYAHTQTLLRRNLHGPLEMKVLVAGGNLNPDESEPGDENEIEDTAELFTSGEVNV
jgi:hypothetical protein